MVDFFSGIFILAVLVTPALCSSSDHRGTAVFVGCVLACALHLVLTALQQRIQSLDEEVRRMRMELGQIRELLRARLPSVDAGNSSRKQAPQAEGQAGRDMAYSPSNALLKPGSQKWCGLRPDPLVAGEQPQPRSWSLHQLPAGWCAKLPATQQEQGDIAELRTRLLRDGHSLAEIRCDELQMLRFLRARKGNIDAAEEMFHHAAGRITRESAGSLINGEFGRKARAIEEYWKPVCVMGLDRDRDPIVWERLGKAHVQSLLRLSDQTDRLEFYTLESVMNALEEEMVRQDRPIYGCTVVQDLGGLSLDHLNPQGLKLFNLMSRIDQDCYPEIIKRVLIINVPWVFEAIWKIVQYFFDQGLRDKMQIIRSKEKVRETLLKYIAEENVPAYLGGSLSICGDDECGAIMPPGGPIPEHILSRFRSE